MAADAPPMTVIPGRATPFRRFGLLPQAPISRPPHEPTPPVAVIAPDAPPIVLTPAAPVAAPAVAPAAPLTTRIPNRQPAPAGVDKWQHNNALALGVLTGSETPEQRAAKIKAYMEKAGIAGATGTDEAAFTAQLRKDAIAVQQLLKSQGLPVGAIDGKLGDISAAAIAAARQRLPEAARDTPTIDLLRQAQAAAPAPAAPAPVAVERPRMVIRQQGPRGP